MIRNVHPGSLIQGQKGTGAQIPDPDLQHWFVDVRYSFYGS
jgi:hypothetical protein